MHINQTNAAVQILQEVLAPSRPRSRHMPLVITNSTEKLERGLKIIPDLTHRGQVSTAVTVVGC